jgi:hypothetical protein
LEAFDDIGLGGGTGKSIEAALGLGRMPDPLIGDRVF